MKLDSLNNKSKQWVTFHQIQKQWWRLKQGSKSAVIAYVAREDEHGRIITNPVVSFHRVFNVVDVDCNSSGWAPITDKQKYLLTKLLKNHYKDDKALLDAVLTKIDSLTTTKASELIKKFMERNEMATA